MEKRWSSPTKVVPHVSVGVTQRYFSFAFNQVIAIRVESACTSTIAWKRGGTSIHIEGKATKARTHRDGNATEASTHDNPDSQNREEGNRPKSRGGQSPTLEQEKQPWPTDQDTTGMVPGNTHLHRIKTTVAGVFAGSGRLPRVRPVLQVPGHPRQGRATGETIVLR